MAESTKTSTLLDTNISIDPSGVIYNIDNTTIEDFVGEYLSRMNVNGIAKVKLLVKNEGKTNPNVAIYLFMNQNSDSIISDINSVPPQLRNKVDKYNVRISDEFKKIIYPLCGSNIESGKAEGKEYFVKLNIFRVVGLMLAAEPNKHSLVITDAKRLTNNSSVISVVKSENYSYSTGNSGDKYARQIDYLEKKH